MECRFSEFQYATGILMEFLNVKGKKIFSIPNLVEEANLGYDLKIHDVVPIYIQFKIPEYMKKSTAIQYNDFLSPYYRIKLRTDSNKGKKSQHELLVNLAIKGNNLVYYVAPYFYTEEDFSINYLASTLISNSLFKNIKGMNNYIDDDEHFICYTQSPSKIVSYSFPTIYEEKGSFDTLIEYLNPINAKEKVMEHVIKVARTNEFISTMKLTNPVEILKAYREELFLNNIEVLFYIAE